MTAPVASFAGISSGINFRELVDQIIAIDRRPADQLAGQVSQANLRKAAWTTFRDRLGALGTAAEALRGGVGVNAVTTQVLGTGAGGRPLVAATAATGTPLGTYRVQVTALATAGTAASRSFASPTAAAGVSGDITINGRTLTVAAGDSLNVIRDRVNALNTGATPTGVSAAVLNTGTGSRLVLRAASTGAAGFSVSGAALTDAAALGATVTAGSDASFSVDGIAMTRASNTVSDVVPGLSLSLLSAEAGTDVQVAVSRDTAAGPAAVQAFVDAYNAAQSFVRSQATQPGAQTQPALAGETALRAVQSRLLGVVQGEVTTQPEGARRLADIGIRVERDGSLSFNRARYDETASANPAAVRTLLADRMTALKATTDAQTAVGSGVIAQRQTSIDRQVARLRSRIDEIDDRLARRRTALLAQFSEMESAVNRIRSQSTAFGNQATALRG